MSALDLFLILPALALVPMRGADEIAALSDDIRRQGLREAIVLLAPEVPGEKRVLLDGRARVLACERAGVEPRFVEWSGPGSAKVFALRANCRRRGLSPSILAMLGAELQDEFRVKRGEARPGQHGRWASLAAEVVGSTTRMVELAWALRQTAPPEVLNAVWQGRLTVNAASAPPRDGRVAHPSGHMVKLEVYLTVEELPRWGRFARRMGRAEAMKVTAIDIAPDAGGEPSP